MITTAFLPRAPRSILAALAAGSILAGGGTAGATEIKVFEAPPTVMQLLDALGEPSGLGRSRTIEIVGAAASPAASHSPVQRVSTGSPPSHSPSTAVASSRPAPDAPAASGDGAFAFRIRFGFDSAVIDPSFNDHLRAVADMMRQRPDIALVVEGHTDAVGDAGYNEALSQRRAAAVRDFLVAGGVEPSRLQVVGRGEREPLTADGRDAANRRVQFTRAR